MRKGTAVRHSVKVIALFLGIFALFFVPPAHAKEKTLTGKVMQVKDGDTVVISPADGGPFFACRLYGIDAPETAHPRYSNEGQRFGEEARRELKRFVFGQAVEVTTTGQENSRREVCIIKIDGQDVNLEMVRHGYAWAFRQHLTRPYASEYIEAEREARAARRGLWQESNPTPPWKFRNTIR